MNKEDCLKAFELMTIGMIEKDAWLINIIKLLHK